MNGRLIDASGRLCARLIGEWSDGLFSGRVVEFGASPAFVGLFQAFEASVNEQRFIDVDRLEDHIESLGLRISFDGHPAEPVTDVQIYPTSGLASFRRAPGRGAESRWP